MAKPTSAPLERFERLLHHEPNTGCWLWGGAINSHGYGFFTRLDGRKNIKAHRAAWILYRGRIPDGLFVLHNCPSGDISGCCNPDHLWLGTQGDNMRDRVNKLYWRNGMRKTINLG